MKTKISRVLKISLRQIGSSNLVRDRKRKALKPGKRLSRDENIYYETRRNRSDSKDGLRKRVFKRM